MNSFFEKMWKWEKAAMGDTQKGPLACEAQEKLASGISVGMKETHSSVEKARYFIKKIIEYLLVMNFQMNEKMSVTAETGEHK